MDRRSPSMPSNSLSPSKLVRAIKAKSSRLGLGEGKHLLKPHVRRNERHQRRSQQIITSEMQSATSQASIYSLMLTQTDQDTASVSSFLGSVGPDLPFPTKLDWPYDGYDSDDKESYSKSSDDFPYRRRKQLYRAGARGTHVFLRLAHLGKTKLVEPIHMPSSVHNSSSYVPSRFVTSNIAFSDLPIPLNQQGEFLTNLILML